jgi:hypothetical protein
MLPEQIPGTLFVLLTALAAIQYSDPGLILLLLALGCAAGWGTFGTYGPTTKLGFTLVAFALWAGGFLLTLAKAV